MEKAYKAALNFSYEGEIQEISPMGKGHINKTYLVITNKEKYTLQCINTNVFKDPQSLMENFYNVTEFISKKIEDGRASYLKKTLSVVKSKDGNILYLDDFGSYWRSYIYIDKVITFQKATDLETVFKAGYAFGDFINILSDYNIDELHETIKDFHNTKVRFENFKKSLEKDIVNRAKQAKEEIEFILKREKDYSIVVDKLEENLIPTRVTHNDTKLNNLLFDQDTFEPVCIVDLDTIMPGSLLYDYGDALRIAGSSAEEDQSDLSKVNFVMDNFIYFTKGFLKATKDSITKEELELLAFSIKLITLEIGMRFLTDYLDNDIYFATKREDHNLIRAKNQFKLVKDIEENLDQMNELVRKIYEELS